MGKLGTQHPRMELNSGVELVRQGFVQRAFSNLMSMDAQCHCSSFGTHTSGLKCPLIRRPTQNSREKILSEEIISGKFL